MELNKSKGTSGRGSFERRPNPASGGIELVTFGEDSDNAESTLGAKERRERGSFHSYSEYYDLEPEDSRDKPPGSPELPEYLNIPARKSVGTPSTPPLLPRRNLRPSKRLQPRFENHIVNIKTPKVKRIHRPRRTQVDFPAWLVAVCVLFLIIGLALDAALWCILLVMGVNLTE